MLCVFTTFLFIANCSFCCQGIYLGLGIRAENRGWKESCGLSVLFMTDQKLGSDVQEDVAVALLVCT